ncbi:MAG: transposase, mutator type, partial [Mycobacterium sp.]|nr:transposase, mutator type [Mycobacterium sp.]
MTAPHHIDVEKLLAEQLATASSDLLRGLLSTFIQALMSAEADALCGAGYGERSAQRSNHRNGLPGAAWQRCRTHYTTNLMSVTPKSSWPWVRTVLHSIFDQPDAESVVAQYDRVLDALTDKLPKVAEHLDGARADLLAFTAFPKQIWRQIWSNNPM